jgi:NADPH:quinone reductase-like Zn-dependent oxidoreductase
MKAVAITRLGGPEVIESIDTGVQISADEGMVVIHTEATSYNNIDAILRTEDFGLQFPIIAGSDVVGRVQTGPMAGKRVMVNPGVPCGSCDMCLSGNRCRYVKILGVHIPGGYAEFVKVPSAQCYEVPESHPIEELAAFPLAFLTAWRMLKTRAKVLPGQTVLIWGATGGLGSAAIAVTRALGGHPIAVTRRSEHVGTLIDYGAAEVVDVSAVDPVDQVARLTGGGVDVVFEGPGAATWDRSIAMVTQGGVIVTAGVTTGNMVALDVEDLYYRQISILGSRMGYADEFEEVLGQLVSGGLRPLVDEVTTLSSARSVHEKVLAGNRCGKVVMLNDL